MKADELLKRLENIKTDEDEINKKREIAEYLVRKLGIKNSVPLRYHIMTKDKKIRDTSSYEKFLKSNKISRDDAYVYVLVLDIYHLASYYLPFLVDKRLLLYAYLSKLGFESNDCYCIVPATGLKYISVVFHYPYTNYVVVEVTDIGTVAINMKLPILVHDIIGTKYVDSSKVDDIALQLNSQKFFAGYNFREAWEIPYRYYEEHDTSLAKEVEAIRDAYDCIFKPYRVVYDLKTKQFQVSGNNESRWIT